MWKGHNIERWFNEKSTGINSTTLDDRDEVVSTPIRCSYKISCKKIKIPIS
jgi:hypothetical protein